MTDSDIPITQLYLKRSRGQSGAIPLRETMKTKDQEQHSCEPLHLNIKSGNLPFLAQRRHIKHAHLRYVRFTHPEATHLPIKPQPSILPSPFVVPLSPHQCLLAHVDLDKVHFRHTTQPLQRMAAATPLRHGFESTPEIGRRRSDAEWCGRHDAKREAWER